MENNNNKFRQESEVTPEELKGENRIEWEKKQKHKRRDKDASVDVSSETFEDDGNLDQIATSKKKSKSRRKKHRKLVYDEDSGQVVIKRQRRRQSDPVDEWDDD